MMASDTGGVMADRLLRKREVKRSLDVSLPTLDRMIRRGDLPIVKLSSQTVRISEAAVRELIAKRTTRRSAGQARPA
jgi:excisionase family DNA binding protein